MTDCSDGYWENENGGYPFCDSCHSYCSTCSGGGEFDCDSCVDGRYLIGGTVTFQRGDGTGGHEEYLGSFNSYEECVAYIKLHRPTANGATISPGGAGSCYAEFDMTGDNDSSGWESAIFPTPECTECMSPCVNCFGPSFMECESCIEG